MATSSFDRRTQIVDLLREHGRVSTRSLSQRYDVSEVTIRHDLAALERQGWLQRVHGGAESLRSVQPEQSFGERRQLHQREKMIVAAAAAQLVQPGQTILLDTSTSAFQLASHLRDVQGIRIVTNSFPAATAIVGRAGLEVVILGGVLRPETSSVVGPFLEQMLAGLHVDWLFLSASGVTAERGLTDADIREVEAKRAMMRSAQRAVALIDHSKFGRESFQTFARLEEIDILITNGEPPPAISQACRVTDVEVRVIPNPRTAARSRRATT